MVRSFAIALTITVAASLNPAHAGDHPGKDEAVAMVKKAVSYWKANGEEKACAAITGKGSQFHDRDLYLVAYALDGTVLAHGGNDKMVGKNLIDLMDVDGKAWVKERVELAQKQTSFWQDYKMTNPVSHKVEPKESYCERVDKGVICGGVYKP